MTNAERLQKYKEMYAAATYNSQDPELKAIIAKIKLNWQKYLDVVKDTTVPPEVIAVLHNRESSLNFTKHLANGDPLTGRTVNVPKGIIPNVNPPYTWQQAAEYVLFTMKRFNNLNWDVANALDNIERYNGLGYRGDNKPWSPYLWSKTQFYKKGKYASDGVYDSQLVDKQWGCVPLLKELGFK